MSGESWPWSVLGFKRMPKDATEIRRAYARALKKIDQAHDIEGFTRLREAYETAMAIRTRRTEANAARRRRADETAASRKAPEVAPAPVGRELEPHLEGTRQSSGSKEGPETIPAPTSREPGNVSEALAWSAGLLEAPEVAPAPASGEPEVDPEDDASRAAARRDEDERFGALLDRLAWDDGSGEPLEDRVLAALASPFMLDPGRRPLIRFQIVRLVRQGRGEIDYAAVLSDRITAKLLLRASDEFGWLVDYAAFRADFAGDVELLDLLLRRAGERPSQHVGKEKPWLSRVPHWIGAIGVGMLALNARLIEDIVAAGGPPAWIALAVVVPLGTAALAQLAITSHRAIRDTIRSASLGRISQLKALLAALLFVAASADLQKDMELGYLSVGTAVPLLVVMWIAEGETGGYRLEIALRRASAWAVRLFQRSG